MNLTNEERIAISYDNGAIHGKRCGSRIEFTQSEYLGTCAAIEAEVEKRVREEIATQSDLRLSCRQMEAIRGGVK